MTVTAIRRKVGLTVLVNGQPLPNVLSASISSGLDQELGTAQVVIPNPPPMTINKFDWITIDMGYSSTLFVQRFAGYIVLPQINYWEPTITLQCEDVLALAKRFHPASQVDFSGLTDEEIVELVLTTIGIPFTSPLAGTGKVVAESDFQWSYLMSGLDVIKQLDAMSGAVVSGQIQAYRTFAGPDGQVGRYLITETPGTNYSYLLDEGINILEGTLQFEETDPSTQVAVIGNGILSSESVDIEQIILNSPYWVKYRALKQQAASLTFASTQELSAWLLERLSKDISHINVATQEDVRLFMPMTIGIRAAHFASPDIQNLWLQNVTVSVDNDGAFTQQLQLAGQIHLQLIGKINPLTFEPPAILPPGALRPPSPLDVFASMAVPLIIKELVMISDVDTPIYVVTVTDTSYSVQGTIASRLWSAAGTGLIATSPPNTEVTYTVAYTDLTGATITLQVTDSNGQTATITRPLNSTLVPTRVEKLYAGTNFQAMAYGGDQWRSYVPSNGQAITAIARRGPHFAADDLHIATADDFRTPGVETFPFGTGTGAVIQAIWKEPNVNTPVLDGATIGGVARAAKSPTGTGLWTVLANPGAGDGATEIRACMVSRFNANQIHVLTDTGYYVSDTGGTGWRTIRLGNFVDFAFSHIGRNIVVTGDGHLQRAEDGTPFTFAGNADPPAPILCCTVHIREDIQYALGSDGKSWVTATPGGWDLEQRQDIPFGAPQVRGMDRSGVIVDKIYFAAGVGGLWETLDGFRSAGGFYKVLDGTI